MSDDAKLSQRMSEARWYGVVSVLVLACGPDPSTDEGISRPLTRGCGEAVTACGCWGNTDGRPFPTALCASGYAVPRGCGALCPLGGTSYGTVCTCDPTTFPDAGSTTQTCGPYAVGVRPFGPPMIACGAPGTLTVQIMQDINSLWGSAISPCACDLPTCPFNAWVLPQTNGYIYYRRDFLQWLTGNAGGAVIGAAWMLSHEAGHNLQNAAGLRYTSSKAAELGADCFSGYFLAWLQCQGRSSMGDMLNATAAICATGDPRTSPWFEPGAHGTCAERLAAVQRGANGYSAHLMPSRVCVF